MSSIYKFSGVDSYKLACLASNTIWFSNLKDFNDPFEGRIKVNLVERSSERINMALKNIYNIAVMNGMLEEQEIKYEEHYPEEYKNELLKIISDVFESEFQSIDKIAACSFMDSGDGVLLNKYMWSHYADGLRGYCLKFNKEGLTDSLAIKNDRLYLGCASLKYSDQVPSIDPVEYFCGFDNSFNNAFLLQSLAPKIQMYLAVATKSISWANEEELRLLAGNKGALEYDSEAIEEIMIGEKMPIDQQNLIVRLIMSVNPKIKIKKVMMKKDSYLLELVDYNS